MAAPGRSSSKQQRHGQGVRGSCCPKRWGGGCGHLPAVPALQTPSPEQLLPGLLSQPQQSLCPQAHGLSGVHCLWSSQSPEKDKPLMSSSLGVSLLPWQQHGGMSLPTPPACAALLLTLGFAFSVRKGVGAAVAGSSPVGTATLRVLLCRCVYGSKVPKSPPGNFRTFSCFPGVSCWAAGCPPEGHSSPIVSLCSQGSPWRRHLSAKAVEMLLGSCTWADGMISLCSCLEGER